MVQYIFIWIKCKYIKCICINAFEQLDFQVCLWKLLTAKWCICIWCYYTNGHLALHWLVDLCYITTPCTSIHLQILKNVIHTGILRERKIWIWLNSTSMSLRWRYTLIRPNLCCWHWVKYDDDTSVNDVSSSVLSDNGEHVRYGVVYTRIKFITGVKNRSNMFLLSKLPDWIKPCYCLWTWITERISDLFSRWLVISVSLHDVRSFIQFRR